MTPWLTVLGRGLDGMPLVEVQLRRAGDELKGVRARVREGGGATTLGWPSVMGRQRLGTCTASEDCARFFGGGGVLDAHARAEPGQTPRAAACRPAAVRALPHSLLRLVLVLCWRPAGVAAPR